MMRVHKVWLLLAFVQLASFVLHWLLAASLCCFCVCYFSFVLVLVPFVSQRLAFQMLELLLRQWHELLLLALIQLLASSCSS
jgi:hypothetical protein